jgi:1,4-alpha-glucan branching enzyme
MTKHITAPTISLLGEGDQYYFHQGSHTRLYDKLGAHYLKEHDGTYFAVWAPNAQFVGVMGDFNGWRQRANPLAPVGDSGIWEGFLPGVRHGAHYKYFIHSKYHDYRIDKADPYGAHHETPPHTGSVVWDLAYTWGDADWLAQRTARQALSAPITMYEMSLSSWRRNDGRYLTYRELTDQLPDYLLDHGFTHVEFMPVMEFPFDGSWGYQVTGYFAPTARFGTPQDFMRLVDTLHQRGIGVILDWVPAHYPTDAHGLGFFDGTHLYEHADTRKGFHPDWNTFIFNFGKNEVRSFLTSSAVFWLDRYHIDGLRVDAVASMLYLDFSRKSGEWAPNPDGSRENLEAIAFLKHVNGTIATLHADTLMIAEESSSFPMVTGPTPQGGLGFALKWDMGWMNDTLTYIARDPVYRKYHQNELTFRSVYMNSERFLLPLSHDEVVHGKKALLSKMPGDEWQRFANLRLLYGYMWSQPGKKLLFMGGEFGQWREWSEARALDWDALSYPPHAGVERWVTALNRFYQGTPAMHVHDCDHEGFEWIDGNDATQSVLLYLRRGRTPEDTVIVALNFTPNPHRGYRAGVPFPGPWREALNSDATEYGGGGVGNPEPLTGAATPHHGREYSLDLTLPPLGVVFLIPETKPAKPKRARKKAVKASKEESGSEEGV